MKHLVLTFTLLMLLVSPDLYPKSNWADRSLYSPDIELAPGSLVVVNISDITNLTYNLSFASKKTGNVSSSPDATITGFLPRVNSSKTIASTDTGEYSAKSRIDLSIAAAVIDRTPQGLYRVTGTRSYVFNGRASIIAVSGLIDSTLIKGRTVDSSLVADFRLEIRVAAEGLNITRPPLAEDQAASYELTEQEKQTIIIDYLEKMLSEIGR